MSQDKLAFLACISHVGDEIYQSTHTLIDSTLEGWNFFIYFLFIKKETESLLLTYFNNYIHTSAKVFPDLLKIELINARLCKNHQNKNLATPRIICRCRIFYSVLSTQ